MPTVEKSSAVIEDQIKLLVTLVTMIWGLSQPLNTLRELGAVSAERPATLDGILSQIRCLEDRRDRLERKEPKLEEEMRLSIVERLEVSGSEPQISLLVDEARTEELEELRKEIVFLKQELTALNETKASAIQEVSEPKDEPVVVPVPPPPPPPHVQAMNQLKKIKVRPEGQSLRPQTEADGTVRLPIVDHSGALMKALKDAIDRKFRNANNYLDKVQNKVIREFFIQFVMMLLFYGTPFQKTNFIRRIQNSVDQCHQSSLFNSSASITVCAMRSFFKFRMASSAPSFSAKKYDNTENGLTTNGTSKQCSASRTRQTPTVGSTNFHFTGSLCQNPLTTPSTTANMFSTRATFHNENKTPTTATGIANQIDRIPTKDRINA